LSRNLEPTEDDRRALFMRKINWLATQEPEALASWVTDIQWARERAPERSYIATFQCRRFECQKRWEVKSPDVRAPCPECGDVGVLFERHMEINGKVPDEDAVGVLGDGVSHERSSRLAENFHEGGDDGPSFDH